MFNKLKDKLKGAVDKFSKDAEQEGQVEEVEKEIQEDSEESEEEPEVTEKEETKEVEKDEDSKGIIDTVKEKITTVELSDEKFEDLFWELEVALMENNVALEVVEKIKADMEDELVGTRIGRRSLEEKVTESLKNSIQDLLKTDSKDLLQRIKENDKPYVIAFVGVNGSGKTTTLAKVAKMLMDNDLSVVFAAADTFRAASMEQLGKHADNLGVKMIQHEYESDPAAVAYDAVEHAESNDIDVVLIDTAGRLHSNKNLMRELKKLVEVNEPDLKFFVGESTVGNDCVEQAKKFDESIGIDDIILSKADVDEKGGAAISISYVTGKPIMYIGIGQDYEDLEKFKPEKVMENLF